MVLDWLKKKFPDSTCRARVFEINNKFKFKVIVSTNYLSADISNSYTKTIVDNIGNNYNPITYINNKIISPIFKKKLIYYLSYIQHKFEEITKKCNRNTYYKEDLKITIRVNVNYSIEEEKYIEPPTEAFLLVKWFAEIQDKQIVPEELEKYILEDMALEILEG